MVIFYVDIFFFLQISVNSKQCLVGEMHQNRDRGMLHTYMTQKYNTFNITVHYSKSSCHRSSLIKLLHIDLKSFFLLSDKVLIRLSRTNATGLTFSL